MIIKSIEINNFLSFYGKQEFSFDQGATLIIGQNNTGKSKLFDAYNWVLYDEAFKTEAEKWTATNAWREELGNRLAKQECKVNGNVEIEVSLEFEDEDSNNFFVTRSYKIKKNADDEWGSPGNTTLSIIKKLAGTNDTIHLLGEDAVRELSRYFPKNLSRYFLFQGENISQLMQLNQRTDFTKAIGELSGIKYFAKAKIYAQRIYDRAKAAFEEKEDSNSSTQQEKIELTRKIDLKKEDIQEVTVKLDNEIRERDKKQELLDEKVNELIKFEACANILEEITAQETKRDASIKLRRQYFEFNRGDLLSQWIYGSSGEHFQAYLTLYRISKEEKKIPEPIRQDFIREMLDEGICKVCGTSAPEGSLSYEHILMHLNDRALDKEVATINTLSDAADTMSVAIGAIDKPIGSFRKELSGFQQEINKAKELIAQKEDELRIVIETIADEQNQQISRNDIEKINIAQVKRDRDQFRNDLEKSKNKIAQFIGNREILEDNLSALQAEYESLIDKSSNEVEKKRMKLSLHIKEHIDKLHDNFLFALINDIEKETNNYFVSMTRTNPALSGKVRVSYQEKEVYPVDEQGTRLSNINQANKVSLQIAFVAAVLSVSNKIWERYFPFVSDAPISALGGNNKISAIKTMIDIFRQSIIILKDDADTANKTSVESDQVRELIKYNDKIKNAYELRMQGTGSILEQHTEVIKIK
ncbi:AAA family ATPase [Mucilaginibacter aquaedulcis]|uniref:AAA family ATPase n=1 Tax=Mucilaginibacter aquaedulcis TaxID=1187081 RepID=UPI0025B4365A|nr:AAA family ATPase [Mucilaginibacter aquaedulcis]MDN3548930.1 AAA family ATPase [Mucilaginibacter aquaedulcis]